MRVIKLESLIEKKWEERERKSGNKPRMILLTLQASHQGEQIKVAAMATIKPKRSHCHSSISFRIIFFGKIKLQIIFMK